MPDTTPILHLPYILPAQAQKHVTHNEAIRVLDVIVQLSVTARNLAAPPASPAEGDRYIVAAGASGDWAGQAGKIALYENGAWQFFAPLAGWTAWVLSEQVLASYTGSTWASQADGPFNVGQLGVSATPDGTNRLSVSAPATLLNHAGAGHQLKLNKAASADTASLLFQTGFSGRAELGTAGGDDFSIKVSADGSAFLPGLSIAAATGQMTLPAALRFGGQASDPVSPPNGTMWLNTTTGEVKVRGNGASVVLAGGAAGIGAGLALIRSANVSSAVATVDFTAADFNSALFSDYIFEMRNLRPATAAMLSMRVSFDGGAVFRASAGDYGYVATFSQNGAGAPGVTGAASAQQINLAAANTHATLGGGLSGTVKVFAFGGALSQKITYQTTHLRADSFLESVSGGGMVLHSLPINGARFLFSTGNIAGTPDSSISMYGVLK